MSARSDLIWRLADEVLIACKLARGARGTIAGACGDAYDAGVATERARCLAAVESAEGDKRGQLKPHRWEEPHDVPGQSKCWLCLLHRDDAIHTTVDP